MHAQANAGSLPCLYHIDLLYLKSNQPKCYDTIMGDIYLVNSYLSPALKTKTFFKIINQLKNYLLSTIYTSIPGPNTGG